MSLVPKDSLLKNNSESVISVMPVTDGFSGFQPKIYIFWTAAGMGELLRLHPSNPQS